MNRNNEYVFKKLCIQAIICAIWQHAAHNTDQLTSSCWTGAIQKQTQKKSIPKWKFWDFQNELYTEIRLEENINVRKQNWENVWNKIPPLGKDNVHKVKYVHNLVFVHKQL